MFQKIFIIAIINVCFWSCGFLYGAETRAYSLGECIQAALENQVDFKVAENNLRSADRTLAKVYSGYWPHLNLSSSYNYGGSSSSDPSNSYSGSLSASQFLWDFGKSTRSLIKSKESNASSHASLEQTKQSLIYSITQYYYAYLRAKHTQELNFETLKKAQRYLERAQAFYEVGKSARIDVTKAEVDVTNSELSYLKSKNSLKLARLDLIRAIGLKNMREFEVEDSVDTGPIDMVLRECIETAFKNRPDVKQQEVSVKTARIDLASAYNFYTLSSSANASLNYSGAEFPLAKSWSWSAYLNFSIPVFDGLSTWISIKDAQENLKVETIQKEEFDESVRYEVEYGYLSMKEAEESVAVAKKALGQAQENLELAEGRYENGIGSIIELADARVSLQSSQLTYIQSVYSYALSIASLKKTMGIIGK